MSFFVDSFLHTAVAEAFRTSTWKYTLVVEEQCGTLDSLTLLPHYLYSGSGQKHRGVVDEVELNPDMSADVVDFEASLQASSAACKPGIGSLVCPDLDDRYVVVGVAEVIMRGASSTNMNKLARASNKNDTGKQSRKNRMQPCLHKRMKPNYRTLKDGLEDSSPTLCKREQNGHADQ